MQKTEPIRMQCTRKSLRKTLRERSPDTNVIFEHIQDRYTTQIKSTETESTGEWTQYMLQYIEQVDSLLCLISTCRSGGYIAQGVTLHYI